MLLDLLAKEEVKRDIMRRPGDGSETAEEERSATDGMLLRAR
jgi:hypothetical protein